MCAEIRGDGGSDFERRFGIRMQATRSRPPRNRWSRQWQAYMESLQMGARIGRGRQYATGGNVRSLEITPGLAVAAVSGSTSQPYRCEIGCEAADAATGARLTAFLRGRPMLLARLLVGDLPEAVETRFRVEGIPLVPSALSPLSVHCSCPDGAAFCKHSAAVLFLLCETFDNDPLLLLEFRGVHRASLYGDASPGAAAPSGAPESGDAQPPPDEFVSGDLVEFPGQMPFWRGESRFSDTIQECMARAADAARRALES